MKAKLFRQAWDRLQGDPKLVASVWFTGPAETLPARLPVTALAQATVGAASAAAVELAAARGRHPQSATVDSRAAAVAFTSERHFRLDGRPQIAMDPLSRFWPAADGWVRLHANYPHHRERLLRALGIGDESPEAVGKAVAKHRAVDVERIVTEHDGLAVAVREPGEWLEHQQGAAIGPLLDLRRDGDAPALRLPSLPSGALLPAAGVRVLDLTRVIAGPVATRTLALLGAEVLRVDNPRLPEIPAQHLDTGPGKRSALLDLARGADRSTLDTLVGGAHVVVLGYRPGALARFGLDPAQLRERHPGLVIAALSAWGSAGPWARRRGFDSLVQAASGIARVEAGAAPAPGALPAQALDHGTGYLLAAAVLRALSSQLSAGGGWYAELSLAQTAAWLLRHRRVAASGGAAPDPAPWLRGVDSAAGALRYALPPLAIPGVPETWASPPVPWGADAPAWRPTPH